MTSFRARHVVGVAELADRMDEFGSGDPVPRILDGSWHMPSTGRDARAEYEASHIPGAVLFDIDAVSDPASPLPHMLPSPEAFAAAAGALGLSETDEIVVYDAHGLFSAARVWFSLRAMGARNVRVLDGGLPAWIAAGHAVTDAPTAITPAVFTPAPTGAIASFADVAHASRTGEAQLLDARGAARFKGEAAEPRAGLRSGHIPGARNLPFDRIVDEAGIRSDDALEALLVESGIDLDRPVVTTCGSGVTAAVLSLALAILGRESRLYDGSWAEWGAREDAPVATGDAPSSAGSG